MSCALQVAGSEWKLSVQGQSAEATSQEPKYSTWEEVLGKKKQANSSNATSSSASSSNANSSNQSGVSSSAQSNGASTNVVDDTYYR